MKDNVSRATAHVHQENINMDCHMNSRGRAHSLSRLAQSHRRLCQLGMSLVLVGVQAVLLSAQAAAGSAIDGSPGRVADSAGLKSQNSEVLPSESSSLQSPPLVGSSGVGQVSPAALAPMKADLMLPYSLREGEPVDRQLAEWAKREGWSLRWKVPVTWEVFSSFDVVAAGSREAIESVVHSLREDGAPIRMHVFSNRVIVIESSSISQGGVAP